MATSDGSGKQARRATLVGVAGGRMALDSSFRRGFIVTLSVVIMFGYFGLAGLVGYGAISQRWMRARLIA